MAYRFCENEQFDLGADAVERVEAKLDLVRRELDQWRHVALSTAI